MKLRYNNQFFPILSAAVVLYFTNLAIAQVPEFVWATSAGRGVETNYNLELGYDIAIDADGNSYVAGYFDATNARFGTTQITSHGDYDALLLKLDPEGNILWAKAGGGKGRDRAYSVAVDLNGNSYLTGSFESTNAFFGTNTLTNTNTAGNSAFFLAKYDPNGNLLWIRAPDKNFSTICHGVGVDSDRNAYVTGSITGTNVIAGQTFISMGSSDVLVLKYDTNGNLFWAKQVGGKQADSGRRISLDPSGAFVIAGTFSSTNVSFDGITLTNLDASAYADIFLAKYDNLGNVVWAASAGSANYPDSVGDVAMDHDGKVSIAGGFLSTIHFGASSLTNSLANRTSYIARYDAHGNPLWARMPVGNYSDEARGIAVDKAGNSYVTGSFVGTNIYFDNFILTNVTQGFGGEYDVFVAKYDDAGNVIWAQRGGGDRVDHALSIACDEVGNCFITGFFIGTNVLYGATPLTSQYVDLFVAKLPSDLPQLTANQAGNQILLSWPASATGFVLESTTNWTASNSWQVVGHESVSSNGLIIISNLISHPTKFFRLRK